MKAEVKRLTQTFFVTREKNMERVAREQKNFEDSVKSIHRDFDITKQKWELEKEREILLLKEHADVELRSTKQEHERKLQEV